MTYDWDDNKNAQNIAAHGIGFEAMETFEWKYATYDIDDRHDYGETRETAKSFIGVVLYVVTYTSCSDVTRIISWRKATKKEQKNYVKETKDR